ncbi:ABC transporter ATP-binding protein [Rhodobacter sp. CZR27]|uniref:ABC transporter ATP-binding protein n=1 Tax=Rhodobacter sp. CZR27 TaxID=2033869 RepID=UPI000BBE421C|nr:ABC transporter ATP-binding protein [Rhodobacter sp. CZR27]
MSRHPAPEPPPGFRARWAALRNVPPFLRMVWRASPGFLILSLLLRLARALIPVTALWFGKLIIDEVVRISALPPPGGGAWAWIGTPETGPLMLFIGAEFALAILSDLLGRAGGLIDTLLTERLTMSSSVRLMDHAAGLDLAAFEDAGFQDRLERARRQSGGRMTLTGQILTLMQDAVTVASLASGLLVYNPWLIVLLVAALVPAFLGEAHFNAQTYSLDFRRTPERRELDYLRVTAASVDTAKEIKIFGLAPFLIERYRMLSESFYRARRRIALARALWGTIFSALGTAGYYLAYLWMIGATLTGRLTIGDLTFLAGSFLRLRGLVEGLLTGFSVTASQALYLEDLFGFFRVEPSILPPARPLPVPRPIREGFRFEGVGFRYPGAGGWAVRDLSFTLKAGETLALVGENGAGKTTLVKLLARLYDPDEGRIMLDGHDLREFDPAALRGAMGVIFQDFVRYSFSAGDNIAVGRIEAREDALRIAGAAARSGADRIVERLPEGYAQMLGKRFRDGVELSGGEWQKLAIARAYMREVEVLILDEPTAALDARSEFEVFQRFKDLSAGRTAVLISHRFSSVRMADRILVLAGGRVEATGTHDELIARPGRYAELFELQAAGYR